MRRIAFMALVLSLVVSGTRLFTGIIYLSDEPTAVLVLKRGPAGWIERPEAQDRPFPEHIVLDREEPSLAYGWLYFALMRAAPILAPSLAAAAVLLLARSLRLRGWRRG